MSNHILINLNIISKIKPNDKIYFNSESLIELNTNSIFQGLIRLLLNNSRAKNINLLNNFYNSVFTHINEIINSKYLNLYVNNCDMLMKICNIEHEQFNIICNELIEIKHFISISINGLNNMKETYSDDILTISKLDIIISSIKTNINKIKNKLDSVKVVKMD